MINSCANNFEENRLTLASQHVEVYPMIKTNVYSQFMWDVVNSSDKRSDSGFQASNGLAKIKVRYDKHEFIAGKGVNLIRVYRLFDTFDTFAGSCTYKENAEGYRYGFGGMEKDDEMKGNGNSYDFGARMHDPRVGRFLSLDPLEMKIPHASPYIYCLNNPVLLIDPDRKFPIPAHKKIIERAWLKTNLSRGFQDMFIEAVKLGAGFTADITNFNNSKVHFDGLQNHAEVQERWKELNKSITDRVSKIGSGNKTFGGYDAEMLGLDLHTVADFYAHSNYVELYIEYYQSKNNGAMPSSVPIYDDGLKIPEFKALMDRTTFDENGKFQGLRTGDFDLFNNEFIYPNRDFGPNSHQQMNKDDTSTPLGALAESVAIKHTATILLKLEDK
jgi:RHS repeat-associated protein